MPTQTMYTQGPIMQPMFDQPPPPTNMFPPPMAMMPPAPQMIP